MKENRVIKLTRASMLLVFALAIIFTGSRLGGAVFNSFVVGPLVNGVIIAGVLIVDIKSGILIALITPVLAAFTGQLAPAMMPFVPFIMLGNVTFAVVFGLSYKHIKAWGSFIGIGVGAALKTLVLILSVKYLVVLFNLSIPEPVLTRLAGVMSYPQFFTGVAGGIIALFFASVFERACSKD